MTVFNLAALTFCATLISVVQSALTASIPVANATLPLQDNVTISNGVEALSKPWIWVNCDSGEREAIKDALKEAHTILASEGTRDMQNHWGDYSTVEYLGPPWFTIDFRDKIQETFTRLRIINTGALNGDNSVHLYCHDGSREPNDCTNFPAHIFTKVDSNNNNALSLVFCTSWFRLGSIDAIYNAASSQPALRYNLQAYENRSRAWITALMMIPSISVWPPSVNYQTLRFPTPKPGPTKLQYVTIAAQAKYLGKLYIGADSYQKTASNPHNWSWYAVASYVQERLGEYPQKPLAPKDLPSFNGLAVEYEPTFNGTDQDIEAFEKENFNEANWNAFKAELDQGPTQKAS